MKEPKTNIEYRSVDALNLLENNPRTIKKADFEKLKESIEKNKEFFEARPIILSNRTGKLVVLGGNQRLRASRELGLKEVPTVLLEGLTEQQEREIVIRDNVSNGDCSWKKSFALKMMFPWAVQQKIVFEGNKYLFRELIEQSKLYTNISLVDKDGKITDSERIF